jgi:osmotically inducible protein OsmC
MKRTAKAKWEGSLKEGKGTLSTQSPALFNIPYTYVSRFEEGMGTNPEELIAAAHAGCFSMAFGAELGKAGFTPEVIETRATITLESGALRTSLLEVKAKVPGCDSETLNRIANEAKENCPVSKALNVTISMELEEVKEMESIRS